MNDRILKESPINLHIYLENIDKSKFKTTVDINEIIEMLSLMLDGYLQNELKINEEISIDKIMSKYKIWLNILKRATYK